jgi:uncharacterized DUF497 family protein
MLQFKYNQAKSNKLLAERGVGFEEIIQAIDNGNLLAITDHYNNKKYKNQKILYVRILEQVYVVPFIQENKNTIFLKTLFASRKARKLFISGFGISD